MRITVCELPDRPEVFADAWRGLVRHTREARSEIVVLPELPFAPWFATRPTFDPAVWEEVVRAHETGIGRLAELGNAVVLGTRAIDAGGRRFNEAFLAHPSFGVRGVHRKRYLPDEAGFWEASWYERGAEPPAVERCGDALASFRVCTELWFFEDARRLGKLGVHLLAVPRATPAATVEKWIAGGRAAAVVAGAFCASSNRAGPAAMDPSLAFGGCGWIIGPDGDVLALTSPERPFVTLEVDLAAAERAKRTYPRYVVD